MARAVLDYVLAEMGQSFDMLFANLRDLGDDDWTWVPPDGVRSIRAIVGHIASTKVMYENYAFGDGSLTWEDPRFDATQSPKSDEGFSPREVVDWLRESHLQLLRDVDALTDDAELDRERAVNWGGVRSTRWILGVLIRHDAYHAGEINHLRALHQHNDKWEWEA